jgi:hypothetical protein
MLAPPRPVQQEEDSEDETIVDEIINQESDDDEFIQTVITKTRKRVCPYSSSVEYTYNYLSAEGSRSYADPNTDR